MSLKDHLVQTEDRLTYERDGAIVLRNVVSSEWIETMREVLDRFHAERPDVTIWASRIEKTIGEFTRDPRLAQLAAELMDAAEARFYYDQLFVRPPQGDMPTPLHQDLPYWPIEGKQVISIWVPFDEVKAESSVVQYVKGSHLWGRMFEPAPFQKGTKRSPEVGSAGYEVIEDPQGVINREEILCWEMEPGDVLVHHPLTLHFATANITKNNMRRALALRYVGPQSHFVDRPGNFMRRSGLPEHYPKGQIIDGAPIEGPDYPLVYRA